MKIFRKERLSNGRRHIYFCGIKIYSYGGKKHVSATPQSDMISVIVDNIITRDGIDDFEYEYLKHWFQNKMVLSTYSNQCAWLICITACLLRGDTDIATTIFLMYHKRFGLQEVENYAPVCRLAQSLGMSNDLITKTIIVDDKVNKIRSKKVFEKMIKKAKSIAIVGRSPMLIGSGKGQEIDKHDIVIRFNMADVSGQYAADFGIKNDIMVINCWNKADNKCFYLHKDYRTFMSFPGVIDSIYQISNKHVDFLDIGLKNQLCHESGLVDPTSGAMIIMWVKKILGSLKKVDIYGFAFQDKSMNLGHYDGAYPINDNVHNMESEINFLKKFVKK